MIKALEDGADERCQSRFYVLYFGLILDIDASELFGVEALEASAAARHNQLLQPALPLHQLIRDLNFIPQLRMHILNAPDQTLNSLTFRLISQTIGNSFLNYVNIIMNPLSVFFHDKIGLVKGGVEPLPGLRNLLLPSSSILHSPPGNQIIQLLHCIRNFREQARKQTRVLGGLAMFIRSCLFLRLLGSF